MTQLPRTLDRVMQVPSRLARTTEFLFRRADATGDVYPDDNMFGTVAGPDPDRVIFMGEAGQISLGVRAHDLSLAAFFARHHHAETHRGVDWHIHPVPTARLADLPAVVDRVADELLGADIVVVLVGITDALRVIPAPTWDSRLRSSVSTLVGHVSPDARILLAEIPPLGNAGSLSRPARVAAGLHGNALNKRTRAMADELPQVTAVSFPEELTRSLWRPESDAKRYTHTYNVWAAHLARHLPS